MKLVFKGEVITGDPCRCSFDDEEQAINGAIWIGDKDVIETISETKFERAVTIGIADERFDGELSVETGWGYSEWTPMDDDVLKVGDHDLIEILRRYEGKEITMFVSDEPINILDV